MYFRTNITQEVIAELLFADQSTISRTVSDLEEIIAEALDEFVPELPDEIEGRVAVVDGSLCPCWSWADAPELYSGKHKTTDHVHQFVCDLFGDLMHISEPLPGNTHDAKHSTISDRGLLTVLDEEQGNSALVTKVRPVLSERLGNTSRILDLPESGDTVADRLLSFGFLEKYGKTKS